MTENEAIKELETSIDLAKMCTQNYERKTKSKVTRWQSRRLKRCSSTVQSALRKNAGHGKRNRMRRKSSHLTITTEPLIMDVPYASGKSYQR